MKNKSKFLLKIIKLQNIWSYIKKLKNEEKIALPMNLNEMPEPEKKYKKLNPNKIDKEHLVIYCHAKFKGK